jgi:hypothetical protein
MDALKFDLESMESAANGKEKYEGFWRSAQVPKDKYDREPWPISHDQPWEGKEEFLKKLRAKQKTCSTNAYDGWSTCRLLGQDGCKKGENGSNDYVAKSGTVEITWPEGYEHYIQVHNVIPSKEFYNFIMHK